MNNRIEMLKKASESFQKRHDLKDGMAVSIKKELSHLVPTDNVGVFMYWLPNSFGGNNDSPLHQDNFMIADCVVMFDIGDGKPIPALSDSRLLEPFIEADERQLQLEL
jgi:hypothetical protein